MLNKKNIAMTMAAATVVTSVAPIFADTVQNTVISVKDEAKMNALKSEIKGYLDTKYNGDVLDSNNDGECVYTIKVSVNGAQATEIKSLKDLQTKLEDLTKIDDSLKITVKDKGHNEVDGKIVDWKTENYKKSELDGVVTEATALIKTSDKSDLVQSVEKTNADTVTIKLKNNEKALVVKTGDEKIVIDEDNAIYSMNEYGKYLNKDGKVIEGVNDANGAKASEDTVVLGFKKSQVALEDEDKAEDKEISVTYANTSSEIVKFNASDLFELKAERYTAKGNELAKFIRDQRALGNTINVTKTDSNTIAIGIVKNPESLVSRSYSASNFANLEITGTDKEITALEDALTNNASVETLAGTNRVKTAVEVSRDQFVPNGTTPGQGQTAADAVVLVSDYAIADGLAATPFAAMKNAPILLTNKDKASDEVMKEIKRLGVDKVYVIGGDSAISENVVNQLENKYLSVERIAGTNRQETSLKIAKEIEKENKSLDTLYVAGGWAEADAMSISAIAANESLTENSSKVAPIILTGANGLSAEQTKWIEEKRTNDISDAYIVGGDAVVPTNVDNTLESVVDNEVKRLAGTNRQNTNAKIVAEFFMEGLNNLYVAKADNNGLVDSLAGGVAAAKNDAPIILVGEDLSADQKSVLDSLNDKTVTAKKQIGYGVASKVMETLKDMITK